MKAYQSGDESPHSTGLEWRVHLAAREPAKGAVAAGLCFLAGGVALAAFGSLGTALAAAVVLMAAVGEFVFPVTYRLSAKGAEARNTFYWRRIEWGEVRRVYLGPDAVKLSPLAHGGPREAFRGVVLRCEENREAVLEAIERYRDAAAPAS